MHTLWWHRREWKPLWMSQAHRLFLLQQLDLVCFLRDLLLSLFLFRRTTENILKAPPSASEWWEEATHPSEDADNEESESQTSTEQLMKSSSSEESESRRFQNCGYDAWEKARTEWREPTATSFPSKPPPVRRAQVIRGITSGKRQYELPGRMTLSDMINVYTDIWAAENGR